jgi:hypothetical protein
MSNLFQGIISGLVFGLISVGIMLPMSFPDKKTALLAAFTSRLLSDWSLPAFHYRGPVG